MPQTCGPSNKHANMHMASHNKQLLKQRSPLMEVGNLRDLAPTTSESVNMSLSKSGLDQASTSSKIMAQTMPRSCHQDNATITPSSFQQDRAEIMHVKRYTFYYAPVLRNYAPVLRDYAPVLRQDPVNFSVRNSEAFSHLHGPCQPHMVSLKSGSKRVMRSNFQPFHFGQKMLPTKNLSSFSTVLLHSTAHAGR